MSKISRFTNKAVQLAKNAVGGRGEVAALTGVAASPTMLSYRSIVCGFTLRLAFGRGCTDDHIAATVYGHLPVSKPE